jgi:hypothetical protein
MNSKEELEKLIKQYEEEAQKNLDDYIYFKDFDAYEKYMRTIEYVRELRKSLHS